MSTQQIRQFPPSVQSGRTIAPYDQSLQVSGHPGAPRFYHLGLGASGSYVGVVGATFGNIRAFLPPPDQMRAIMSADQVNARNTRMGRRTAGGAPTRGNAPAVGTGQ